jgi:hypothetical protein
MNFTFVVGFARNFSHFVTRCGRQKRVNILVDLEIEKTPDDVTFDSLF